MRPTASLLASMSASAVLGLQRTAGNAAAGRLLATTVQRCGAIPPDQCPCHDAESGHDTGSTGGSVQRAAVSEPARSLHPTVRSGSSGQPVFEAQVKLNLEGADPLLSADSLFGSRTDGAVRAFQSSRNLRKDGIVGPQTWGALDAGLPAVPQPPDCGILLQALGHQRSGADTPTLTAQAVPSSQLGVPSACSSIPAEVMAVLVSLLGAPKPAPVPPGPVAGKCTSATAPGDVIDQHTVSPAKISKPGDKVAFTATFKCLPRTATVRTLLETTGGANLGSPVDIAVGGLTLTREWDGFKPFPSLGGRLLMADDGVYRHRIQQFTFAFSKGKDLKATGAGLISPPVTIDARAKVGAQNTPFNVILLARIIASEMASGEPAEQEAIGWAVRNQMLRLNTDSVGVVIPPKTGFGDANTTAGNQDQINLAVKILSAPTMAGDTTNGAVMWFSPRSMPRTKEGCKGMDCRGHGGQPVDTIDIEHGNKAVKVFVPSFSDTMTRQRVAGIRDWFLMLYSP